MAEREPSEGTFTIVNEDHTLANPLKFMLNRDSDVYFAGYSVPHPSDNVVNIRVQTNGKKSAKDAMRVAIGNLKMSCSAINTAFEKGLAEYHLKTGTKEEADCANVGQSRMEDVDNARNDGDDDDDKNNDEKFGEDHVDGKSNDKDDQMILNLDLNKKDENESSMDVDTAKPSLRRSRRTKEKDKQS